MDNSIIIIIIQNIHYLSTDNDPICVCAYTHTPIYVNCIILSKFILISDLSFVYNSLQFAHCAHAHFLSAACYIPMG